MGKWQRNILSKELLILLCMNLVELLEQSQQRFISDFTKSHVVNDFQRVPTSSSPKADRYFIRSNRRKKREINELETINLNSNNYGYEVNHNVAKRNILRLNIETDEFPDETETKGNSIYNDEHTIHADYVQTDKSKKSKNSQHFEPMWRERVHTVAKEDKFPNKSSEIKKLLISVKNDIQSMLPINNSLNDASSWNNLLNISKPLNNNFNKFSSNLTKSNSSKSIDHILLQHFLKPTERRTGSILSNFVSSKSINHIDRSLEEANNRSGEENHEISQIESLNIQKIDSSNTTNTSNNNDNTTNIYTATHRPSIVTFFEEETNPPQNIHNLYGHLADDDNTNDDDDEDSSDKQNIEDFSLPILTETRRTCA